MRILLVEDHSDTLQFVRVALEARGHEVRAATSAEEAITLGLAEAFDLLLCDIMLGDGPDGWDVMRTLHERTGIRGIAISAMAYAADVARSREAGFAAHLSKPVDLDLLEATIRDVTPQRCESR